MFRCIVCSLLRPAAIYSSSAPAPRFDCNTARRDDLFLILCNTPCVIEQRSLLLRYILYFASHIVVPCERYCAPLVCSTVVSCPRLGAYRFSPYYTLVESCSAHWAVLSYCSAQTVLLYPIVYCSLGAYFIAPHACCTTFSRLDI